MLVPHSNATRKMSSAGRKRALTYTPGAPVASKKACSRKARAPLFLMPEIWDKILEKIVGEQRNGASVILLSMVNRQLREQISGNWPLWYQLYRQWRGPLQQRSQVNHRHLLPSVPRTVPNFRTSSLSIRYSQPTNPKPLNRQTCLVDYFNKPER